MGVQHWWEGQGVDGMREPPTTRHVRQRHAEGQAWHAQGDACPRPASTPPGPTLRRALWQEEVAYVRAAIIRGAEAYHHTPEQPHLHTPALRDARQALEGFLTQLRAHPDLQSETPRGLVREAVQQGIDRAEQIERRAGALVRDTGHDHQRDRGR
jgi:hypothetical protein